MKVFISSTCNDMTHERDTVERIIKEHGHEAIRSESPSFEARMHAHPHDSCLLALRDCDYVIVIIGGEFGKPYDGKIMKDAASHILKQSGIQPSVTWIELAYAIKSNKPYAILVDEQVYAELKLFRKNDSDNRLDFIKVKDSRVFTFINYYNNRTNSHWMTIYRNTSELEARVQQVCKQLTSGVPLLNCERTQLASIMPGFTYRSKIKMALIYVRHYWEDSFEGLWELKSRMFQRGFEAYVLDYIIGRNNKLDLTHCSSILLIVNKYNLSAIKKLASEFANFDHITVFVAGNFVKHNCDFLRESFDRENLGSVHLIPYSFPQNIFNYLIPYLNQCIANSPSKEMSVIEELGLDNAKKSGHTPSISIPHPTITHLRYSNARTIPSLYTSEGCRNGCRTCGPFGYMQNSIYQSLDDNVMEQLSTLYDLGHYRVRILDQDIFCCGHARIERLFYLSNRHFPRLKFEINFLINDATKETHVNHINRLYNYGLDRINYFLCQEGDAKRCLDLFKKIINQQNKYIATTVIVYLGRKTENMKFYDDLSKIMRSSKKQYSNINWDVRFATPEIINGRISIGEGYRVCSHELGLFDAKKPVMFYNDQTSTSHSPRSLRVKMLDIYELASKKDSKLNPPLHDSIAETFKSFSKICNNDYVSADSQICEMDLV